MALRRGGKEGFSIYGADQEEAAPFFLRPQGNSSRPVRCSISRLAVHHSYFSVHIQPEFYNANYESSDLSNN